MHAGRHYSLKELLIWTRRETLIFVLLACIPPGLCSLGVDVGFLPWPPLAVLGIAVAFVTGFRSNAAYGRLWEARQIWGAIVNASRTWFVMARDFVGGEDERQLMLRHIAWLTALRYQLREPRSWENSNTRDAQEYQQSHYQIPERAKKLDEALEPLLSAAELARVLQKKNRASMLLSLQSEHLRRCAVEGRLTEYRQVELVRMVSNLFDQQGRCERIKNFPYPRQFATLNVIFIWVFLGLLPFGVINQLKDTGPWEWLTLPLSVLISWVFHTMEKIGDWSENPFEGGPNDVPITTMSRAIEIDLRDLANEADLPAPIAATNEIQM
ncbi:MAG TPA: bestrophin family ion channel [Polyangiales bacterium]|nr:bestrophin family ion channel [Polyangiales bacterium]